MQISMPPTTEGYVMLFNYIFAWICLHCWRLWLCYSHIDSQGFFPNKLTCCWGQVWICLRPWTMKHPVPAFVKPLGWCIFNLEISWTQFTSNKNCCFSLFHQVTSTHTQRYDSSKSFQKRNRGRQELQMSTWPSGSCCWKLLDPEAYAPVIGCAGLRGFCWIRSI